MLQRALCLIVFSIVLAVQAVAEDCFGVTTLQSTNPGNLIKFSGSTGATISMVPLSLAGETVLGGHGIARHPITGVYYALLSLDDGSGGTRPGRELVTVNVKTGVCTSVGDSGDKFVALAFDSAETLYGVTGDGANVPETLYTLNLIDGSATFFLTLGTGFDGEAIAFNPDDGHMYHMSGLGAPNTFRFFEKINLTDMTVTPITLSGGGPAEEVQGMKYVGGGVFLYSFRLIAELWHGTTTGAETFVANSPGGGLRGFSAAAPQAVPAVSRTGFAVAAVLMLVLLAAVLRPTRTGGPATR